MNILSQPNKNRSYNFVNLKNDEMKLFSSAVNDVIA